jgi:hypothetical protein
LPLAEAAVHERHIDVVVLIVVLLVELVVVLDTKIIIRLFPEIHTL